jgi:hypothetical protein
MKIFNNLVIRFLICFLLAMDMSHCQKNNENNTAFVFPLDTTVLKTYVKEKPRLILTQGRIQELKSLAEQDTVLSRYVSQFLDNASKELSGALPVYYSSGILDQSQLALSSITTLSFAYLWTGEAVYAERAKRILLEVSDFPDWNYKHFLDAAVMGTAVSLGFDWLYSYLDNETKGIVMQALIDNCLEPGKKAFVENASYGTWINAHTNWNFVCNSSLIISSLAIAEWHREYADVLIPYALKSFPIAFGEYSPSGACFEGPLYEKFALDFYSYCLSCMQSSLNNMLKLNEYPGLNKSGEFFISCCGHSAYLLCFSDILEKAKRPVNPSLFFLGNIFNKNNLVSNEMEFLKSKPANVFHVIWYKQGNPYGVAGNQYFAGETSLVCFDDQKYGNNSFYVGVKAGVNNKPHSHLDLGNFEFDALGERWARDLGFDDYSLTDYFSYGVGAQRWKYYRCGSLSHNVPVINGSNQYELASTSFSRSSIRTDLPYCIIDLSDAYRTYATTVNRGIKLIDANRSLVIQDEYVLKTDQECYWGITTDAAITISDSKNAKLTLNGKEVYATIISPANATFSTVSAYQAPPQNANTGANRLIAKKPKDGTLTFTIMVQLSPKWDTYYSNSSQLIPLSQWQ